MRNLITLKINSKSKYTVILMILIILTIFTNDIISFLYTTLINSPIQPENLLTNLNNVETITNLNEKILSDLNENNITNIDENTTNTANNTKENDHKKLKLLIGVTTVLLSIAISRSIDWNTVPSINFPDVYTPIVNNVIITFTKLGTVLKSIYVRKKPIVNENIDKSKISELLSHKEQNPFNLTQLKNWAINNITTNTPNNITNNLTTNIPTNTPNKAISIILNTLEKFKLYRPSYSIRIIQPTKNTDTTLHSINNIDTNLSTLSTSLNNVSTNLNTVSTNIKLNTFESILQHLNIFIHNIPLSVFTNIGIIIQIIMIYTIIYILTNKF